MKQGNVKHRVFLNPVSKSQACSSFLFIMMIEYNIGISDGVILVTRFLKTMKPVAWEMWH